MLPDGRAETVLVSPPESGPFPIVVMSSHGDEKGAVSAIRQGAMDYIVKSPGAFADMPRTVERTLREWRAVQETRKAQEALRENERRLTTLMANLPGMAYRCQNTPDWPMTFVSEGCTNLTGYPAEALQCNQPAFGPVIVAEDRQPVWDAVQAAMRKRQPFELTYRIRTAHGQLKWV
jgi:PAS domain-containing protein